MKILQCNVNRSRGAMDLVLATAVRRGVQVLLVSEPNRHMIKDNPIWNTDEALDSAIRVLDSNAVVEGVWSGYGFVSAAVNGTALYSCYCSGNRSMEELEQTLEEIQAGLWRHGRKAIVAGDFNAKSPQWGCPSMDRRGRILEEWIAGNDMEVVNVGNAPTFKRREQASILDVTLAYGDARARVARWAVLDEETLSDHSYVEFETVENAVRPLEAKGWVRRRMAEDKLEEEARAALRRGYSATYTGLRRTLTELSDSVMPKKRPGGRWRGPVYWWTAEIAELRREAIRRRRLYTRGARENPARDGVRWEELQESRKALRAAIKRSKRDCWRRLCEEVDSDVFGDGFRLVMKKVRGAPENPRLTMERTLEVVNRLFPRHPKVELGGGPGCRRFGCDTSSNCDNMCTCDCDIELSGCVACANCACRYCVCDQSVCVCESEILPIIFTEEEVREACAGMKKRKAPGPSGVPVEVLSAVVAANPGYVAEVFSGLKGRFPPEWKQARVVLCHKKGRPVEDPSAYRPLCMLDAEGKLYERLVLGKLNEELERTGGLAEEQFGFRKGRQALDAVKMVVGEARKAAAYAGRHKKICAAVTLDVRNAFNCASWQVILDCLKTRGVSSSVLGMVRSYLAERSILLEAEGVCREVMISSGVPQGSVLGPTLWNIMYDDLAKMEMPQGVRIICFADDVAVVAVERTVEGLMRAMDEALDMVSAWMRLRRLQLAPEKTEAVLLTRRKRLGETVFKLEGTEVVPAASVKYLGVWLDKGLTFGEHIRRAVETAGKTASALSRLMPNTGGPAASKRRVLAQVVLSQVLYAAPIYAPAMEVGRWRKMLQRMQRGLCLRVTCAYRTVSSDAAEVIAGMPPIDLVVRERQARYEGLDKAEARRRTIEEWQRRWERSEKGRWTHRLIPDVRVWMAKEKTRGEPDYYATQALTGHGSYRQYLHRIGKAESNECIYCEGKLDDAEHTLFACYRWDGSRRTFQQDVGRPLSEEEVREALQEGGDRWKRVLRTMHEILREKSRDM